MGNNVLWNANTQSVLINTGNPNLDGSGAIQQLLIGGDDGTFVSSVIVKALGSTSQGMVRIFLWKTGKFFLYKEVQIPENLQTPETASSCFTIIEPFNLESGVKVYVSTQNSESFKVTAVAENWQSCHC